MGPVYSILKIYDKEITLSNYIWIPSVVSLHLVKSQEIQKFTQTLGSQLLLFSNSSFLSCMLAVYSEVKTSLQSSVSVGGWIHTIKVILDAVWLFNNLYPEQGCSPFVAGLCRVVGSLGAPCGFPADQARGRFQRSQNVGGLQPWTPAARPALGLGLGLWVLGALCAGTGVPCRPLLPPRR